MSYNVSSYDLDSYPYWRTSVQYKVISRDLMLFPVTYVIVFCRSRVSD